MQVYSISSKYIHISYIGSSESSIYKLDKNVVKSMLSSSSSFLSFYLLQIFTFSIQIMFNLISPTTVDALLSTKQTKHVKLVPHSVWSWGGCSKVVVIMG